MKGRKKRGQQKEKRSPKALVSTWKKGVTKPIKRYYLDRKRDWTKDLD